MHDPWSRLQRQPGYPVTAVNSAWTYKSEASIIEERERSRERERERERDRERERERDRERERERQRREREREEQRKAEEKRKLDAERAEREKERERREKERREQERREQERERMMQQQQQQHQQHQQQQHQQHQQHLQAQHRLAAEASKARDRSPIRNGGTPTDSAKDKEDELAMLSRTSSVGPPFPHPYLSRLPMSRGLPPHPSYPHAPPGSMWPGPDPYRDAAAAAAYRFDPMRLQFNPLMSALQQEEERAKMYGQYPGPVGPPNPMAHLRAKDPSPPAGMLNNHQFHHRPSPSGLPPPGAPHPGAPHPGAPHPHPHKMTPTPPAPGQPLVVDLHKKDEPATQSR